MLNLQQAHLLFKNTSSPVATLRSLCGKKVFRFAVLRRSHPEANNTHDRNWLDVYFFFSDGKGPAVEFINNDTQSDDLISALSTLGKFRSYSEEVVGFDLTSYERSCIMSFSAKTVGIKVVIKFFGERERVEFICSMFEVRRFKMQLSKMVNDYPSSFTHESDYSFKNLVRERKVGSRSSRWIDEALEEEVKRVEEHYRRYANRKLRRIAVKGKIDPVREAAYLKAIRKISEDFIMKSYSDHVGSIKSRTLPR